MISAVLTAFIIESYKLLQPDQQDTTNNLLQQQLNQSVGLPITPPPPFVRTAFAIRLNTLWFSSLVFSLSAASLGILVKQWLQSYTSSAASSPRESARVRQFRYQGLIRWRVPEVIALLPILVQVALAFFFVGLVDLLWKLDSIVAGIVSVIVASSLLFVVVTTFTPSFSRDCPHKSPQSLTVYRFTQWVLRGMMRLMLRFTGMLESRQSTLYIDPIIFMGSRRRRRLSFLDHVLGRHHHTWREREKDLMRERDSHLDHQLLVNADATLMDDEFLTDVLRTCLNDTECPAAIHCVIDILVNRAHASVAGKPRWKPFKSVEVGICSLIHMTADILPRMPKEKTDNVKKLLQLLDQLCTAFPFEHSHELATKSVYDRLFHNLSPYLLHENEDINRMAFTIMHVTVHPRMVRAVRPTGLFICIFLRPSPSRLIFFCSHPEHRRICGKNSQVRELSLLQVLCPRSRTLQRVQNPVGGA